MYSSQIGDDALVCSIMRYCHRREVNGVVFNVVGHSCSSHGSVCFVIHVVYHPVDPVVGPSDFTGEGEVCRVYWNCVVSDHHRFYSFCKQQKSVFRQ